jgi:fructokinase
VSKLVGGVETGGTWTVCALGTGPDDIRAEAEFGTRSPEETLDQVVQFFCDRGEGAGAEAIGIGSFGPVDADRSSPTWGSVTSTPKPGWEHTPVATVIGDALGVPVAFDTDVNAAAIGEFCWGAGRGVSSLCYLTVGTGVGAGLLVDGRPVRGLVHPEVGHIRVPVLDPFPGVCPVHGNCWEGLASGPAIEERWGASPAELPDEHEAWPLEAEYLALGILSIVLVASPELIVVGGGVLERSELLPMVRERLRDLNGGYLETPSLGSAIDRYLVSPALGDRAGVLGAIALAQTLLSERSTDRG